MARIHVTQIIRNKEQLYGRLVGVFDYDLELAFLRDAVAATGRKFGRRFILFMRLAVGSGATMAKMVPQIIMCRASMPFSAPSVIGFRFLEIVLQINEPDIRARLIVCDSAVAAVVAVKDSWKGKSHVGRTAKLGLAVAPS